MKVSGLGGDLRHEAQTRADRGRGGGGGSGGGDGGDGGGYDGCGRKAREEPRGIRWCCVTTCRTL